MTAFADLGELANRKTGGNSGLPDHFLATKDWKIAGAAVTTIASFVNSAWLLDGSPSGGSVPPVIGAYCDNATVGGIRQTSPGGGRQKFLDYVAVDATLPIEHMIVDRLYHCSGLSGLVAAAPQTVPLPASGSMRGPANGVGNQIWIEIYTQIGATATTLTATYTNQDNVSKTSPAIGSIGGTNAREVTRMIVVPLAAGDTGVRSVQSVTLAGSTLTQETLA